MGVGFPQGKRSLAPPQVFFVRAVHISGRIVIYLAVKGGFRKPVKNAGNKVLLLLGNLITEHGRSNEAAQE